MNLRPIQKLESSHILLEILVKLFTLGIFSTNGGAKAWFEIVLVFAALCASGYLLWWQIPLLIISIILATFAAGMFCILAPQYMEAHNIEVSTKTASTIEWICERNFVDLYGLSGRALEQRLKQIEKAKSAFTSNSDVIRRLPQIQRAYERLNQEHSDVSAKVDAQHREDARQKQYREELRRQQRAAQDAERKAAADKQRREQEQIAEQRRKNKYTGGRSPDESYDPPRCWPGYRVKVTLNGTPDGFSGIIWKPTDAKYEEIIPKWCYSSVQEAEAERGQYRFRRPRNNKGEPIP